MGWGGGLGEGYTGASSFNESLLSEENHQEIVSSVNTKKGILRGSHEFKPYIPIPY